MIPNKCLVIALLALISACGKISQVQDSFVALSGNNDLTMVDVRIGALYRNDPAVQPQGYDFIEFENTQYRIGNVDPEVAPQVAQIPRGQVTPVYFKGTFARRTGVSASNPNVAFDVVDITGLAKK